MYLGPLTHLPSFRVIEGDTYEVDLYDFESVMTYEDDSFERRSKVLQDLLRRHPKVMFYSVPAEDFCLESARERTLAEGKELLIYDSLS